MSAKKNTIGLIFGRLTVLADKYVDGRTVCCCRCSCGVFVDINACSLRRGLSKSCGCLRSQLSAARETKHGLAGTPIYNVWATMLARCTNPNSISYKDYGGRGITVCERWSVFENFLADMGERPTSKHSIERKKNDLGYEKTNCVWATRLEQGANTRANRYFYIDGEKVHLSELARRVGLKRPTLARRLRVGLSIEDALKVG